MIFLKSHQGENPDAIFIDRKLFSIENCRPIHFIKFPRNIEFSLLLGGHENAASFCKRLYPLSSVWFFFNFGPQFFGSALIFHLSI